MTSKVLGTDVIKIRHDVVFIFFHTDATELLQRANCESFLSKLTNFTKWVKKFYFTFVLSFISLVLVVPSR